MKIELISKNSKSDIEVLKEYLNERRKRYKRIFRNNKELKNYYLKISSQSPTVLVKFWILK